MEKVKIQSVVDSGKKTKDGNPLISVVLEDGRKCTSFSSYALNWSGEMELDVRLGQKIGDTQYYNIFAPQNKKSTFSQKDFTFEKRNASLQRAIETAVLMNKTTISITSIEILSVAEKYYQYLNKK
jgi:hypothetical protein